MAANVIRNWKGEDTVVLKEQNFKAISRKYPRMST
jgi:hypothetical protein